MLQNKLKSNNLNSSYENLYTKFQKDMFKMSLVIIIICFILECLFFPICKYFDMIELDNVSYIIYFILRPTFINCFSYFISIFLYKKQKISEDLRKMLPITNILIMCCNILVTHSIFSVLYAILIIPIFLSVAYSNSLIIKKIANITVVLATISFVAMYRDKYTTIPTYFSFNCFLTYCLIYCVCKISLAVVIFEKNKEALFKHAIEENIQLEKKVLYDGLTDLYNHTALLKILDEILKNKAYNTLHVAILDIDFFKKVNDTFGHETGNVVLQTFAKHLKSIKNEKIDIARYGGEEFAIVFRDCSTEECFDLIENLRKIVEKHIFVELNNKNITFSTGLASYEYGLRISEFFEKADKALYHSKQNGRNQITIAE